MNYEGSNTVSKHELHTLQVCEKYFPYNIWIFPAV